MQVKLSNEWLGRSFRMIVRKILLIMERQGTVVLNDYGSAREFFANFASS